MIWPRFIFSLVFMPTSSASLQGDIWRFDGTVIPGTAGITPGPGVQLDRRDLNYAELNAMDIFGAIFEASNLTGAHLYETLTNANLTHANLASARLPSSILISANLKGANLTGADLSHSELTNADLMEANLTNSDLSYSVLTNANLMGASVRGTKLNSTTSRGFTKEQLYLTAGYQAGGLQGIGLGENDLTNWDFNGQDLSNARMSIGVHRMILCDLDSKRRPKTK